MKGLLFDHFEITNSFPDGISRDGYRWCVEHEGKKYHITQKEFVKRFDSFYTSFDYDIKPCDGSCDKKEKNLPPDVEKAFLEWLQKIKKDQQTL